MTIRLTHTTILPGADELTILRHKLANVHDDCIDALHELETGRPHAAKQAVRRAIKESA